MTAPREPIAAVRIGIVGEPTPGYRKHESTVEALRHAADALSIPIEVEWIGTESLAGPAGEGLLADCSGLVAPPQSPVRALEGVLAGVRVPRERFVPFLGTCGGFQHTLLEFARNVVGIADAIHEEYASEGGTPVIARASCSIDRTPGAHVLAGAQTIHLTPGSRLAAIYGASSVDEELSCSFALNPAMRERLEGAGLRVAGTADDGSVRAVEIADHPFFLATLFLPQFASAPARPHPVFLAFLDAASRCAPIRPYRINGRRCAETRAFRPQSGRTR